MIATSSNSSLKENTEVEKKSSKLSSRNILAAIGSKLFSVSQADAKETDGSKTENVESDEKSSLGDKKSLKEEKRIKLKRANWKRTDPDVLKFKAKYNVGIGKIMRSWISLIYCILILRLNLMDFIQNNIPNMENNQQRLLQSQLHEENLTIYRMVKRAQAYSQDKSLYLWTHLEKLIYSRMLIKNALRVMQGRDASKDWQGASANLAAIEEELQAVREVHKALKEKIVNDELVKLEKVFSEKEEEIDKAIKQISQMKKMEVQLRGRILLNMKYYQDLLSKKKYLLGIQKELNSLKQKQLVLQREFKSQIQSIKDEIEESEKQIKLEKEEKKRLRASLDVMGDIPFDKGSVGIFSGSHQKVASLFRTILSKPKAATHAMTKSQT